MSAPAEVLTPARHLELVASEVAELAAEFVRGSIGKASAAATKSTPTDVVTATDLESERLIRQELTHRCPASHIIGEEFDDAVGSNGIGWIVDPIDGTVNFLYDLPVVAISIAATIDGTVVAGAVVDLLRRETFSATLGGGARQDDGAIGASDRTDLAQALIGTGFAYDAETRATEADILRTVLPECRDVRCMGSAALNLCWVANGRLDAFYERAIKVYDYAAGALIAAEAGASVELPAQNTLDLTLAATPAIFAEVRSLVS